MTASLNGGTSGISLADQQQLELCPPLPLVTFSGGDTMLLAGVTGVTDPGELISGQIRPFAYGWAQLRYTEIAIGPDGFDWSCVLPD